MIFHVVGRVGSGKTLWSVAKILDSLIHSKKTIITNIRLIDFWDYKLSLYVSKGIGSFAKFLLSPMPDLFSFRQYLARSYVDRYVYEENLEKAVEIAFAGGEANEGTKLFIWDEIHLELNARDWKRTSGRMIQFFSMSRKLGYDVIIISQLRSAVDRQMRDLADVSYELKNLKFFKFFGVSLAPNVGLLVKRWANKGFEHGGGMFVGAGIVRYGSFQKMFYNTLQLLTEKNTTSPKIWFDQFKNSKLCCNCSYFNYYLNYEDFITSFYPDGAVYDKKLAGRLIEINIPGEGRGSR